MALPDTETEPPGLLSMPAEILDMIMEHFDLETIQILRKVCHHIRSHIDNFPQDPYLTHITIFQSRKRPNLARDGYISVMYTSLKNQNIEVEYQKNGKNGCRILFENREKTIENQEFASVLGNDLGLILRNQNLEMTRIRFVFPPNPKSRLSENCLETFHGRFLAALTPHLESRRTLIPTEKIHILGINQESQIMKILQFLDPSSLELILIRFDKQRGFSSPTMKIDGLIGLDQWKQAKSISIHGLNLASGIENFSHLERSAIELKQISVDELMVLREVRSVCVSVYANVCQNIVVACLVVCLWYVLSVCPCMQMSVKILLWLA
ncbi:unnamed protein product [Caenorhabditis brenneri]